MKAILIPVISAVAAALGACSGDRPAAAPPHAPLPGVAAAVIQPQGRTVPEEIRLPGTVRGSLTAVLTARNGGQVSRVSADAGDRVAKGTVLVEVDTDEARAAVAQAEAQATQARADWQQAADDDKRYRTLLQRGAITKRDYELIKHRYEAAAAAVTAARRGVTAARRRLDYAVVRAPFAGVVTERRVDPGDMVTPGAALLGLSGGGVEVRVYAAEDVFARIGVTTPVTVQAGGRNYSAAVTQRVGAADPATHTHLIKLSLRDGSAVPSGAYAVAAFSVGQRTVLTVPATAVITRAGLTGVLTVDDDGTAHFRQVRTGAAAGGHAEIAAGLAASDHVVEHPLPSMGNGTRIIAETAHD